MCWTLSTPSLVPGMTVLGQDTVASVPPDFSVLLLVRETAGIEEGQGIEI